MKYSLPTLRKLGPIIGSSDTALPAGALQDSDATPLQDNDSSNLEG